MMKLTLLASIATIVLLLEYSSAKNLRHDEKTPKLEASRDLIETYDLPECYEGPNMVEKDSSLVSMCKYDETMVQINEMKTTEVTLEINDVWSPNHIPGQLRVFVHTNGIDAIYGDGFQCLDPDGSDLDIEGDSEFTVDCYQESDGQESEDAPWLAVIDVVITDDIICGSNDVPHPCFPDNDKIYKSCSWRIVIPCEEAEMCTEQPSSSPTSSPTTPSPTVSPTSSPTKSPTLGPTVSPTASPTPGPTADPTVSPTSSPTKSPTLEPTVSPTVSPTPGPTADPTASPTSSPTTLSPTVSPTSSPTKSLTLEPTVSPTPGPTADPTVSPTSSPTTLSPTVSPTSSPTKSPTLEPTVSPTARAPLDTFGDDDDDGDDKIFPPVGPAICPEDISVFSHTGVTGLPEDAVRIVSQDSTTVTVELTQAYMMSELSIDNIYYQYQTSAFSNKCFEKDDFYNEDSVTFTIECTQTSKIALLELWVADDITKGVLSEGDNAIIPDCCYPTVPEGTPVTKYVIEIQCAECPEDS